MKILVVSVETGSAHVNIYGKKKRDGNHALLVLRVADASPEVTRLMLASGRATSLPFSLQPQQTFPAKSRRPNRYPSSFTRRRLGPTQQAFAPRAKSRPEDPRYDPPFLT